MSYIILEFRHVSTLKGQLSGKNYHLRVEYDAGLIQYYRLL